MPTKDHQARAFALAIATIRSDAETLDDAPLYCDMEDRKTYRYVDHLPRKEYRLPAPGNPRGMIVSAPAARDSLTALADRLEKGARAFGGQPPKRDRSPLNTRGIVAARNAHAEGHHNAAHRALGDRLFIAASGHPFAVVSQMQAAGHDILLCRSIAARSNTIIAFCARSGVRLATAGQTSGSAPAEFNDFCAWLDSKSAVYSAKLESMASLDQAAAVADYLAGDTVEAIDPEAEPCDTAAAIARAEASAAPEPEPMPEPSPCDATDAPADPEETTTPASADACKAGDTAGEKLARPQAVDKKAKSTYAIKPTPGGFVIESNNGGGIVLSRRPLGPSLIDNVPPRVFQSEADARAYMQSKGMQEDRADQAVMPAATEKPSRDESVKPVPTIKPRYRYSYASSRWLPACPRAGRIGTMQVLNHRGRAVICPSSDGIMKTEAARIAESLGGRWSHRAGGYVMSSPARADAAARLHAAGWSACSFTRKLTPPSNRAWSRKDLPRGASLAA